MRHACRNRRRLALATAAAVGSVYAANGFAQTFDTTATVTSAVQIEATGNFTGTQRRVTAESLSSGAGFAGYAVLDFGATSFSGGNLVSNINTFKVNLWDLGRNVIPTGSSTPDSFATAGPVDVYLSTVTSATTTWKPDTNSTSFTISPTMSAGVDLIGTGGNTNTGAAPVINQLFSLGTLNYVPQPATSTTVGTYSLDLSSTLGQTLASNTNLTEAQFIAQQINSGGKVRLIIAPQYSGSGSALTGTAADFVGTSPPSGVVAASPQVELSGNIVAAPTNNAVLSLVSGTATTKTITLPTIPRLWRFGNATSAVTLNVGGDGTNGVRYLANGDSTRFTFTAPTPAPSGTSAGVFTLLGGGGTVGPGTTGYSASASLHNLDNPNDTTDISIVQSVGVLLDTRTVGLQTGGNTYVSSGGFLTVNLNGGAPGVLNGETVSDSINLGTSNPSNINPGSNSLNLVRLAASATGSFSSATKGTATISTGLTDVTFGSGVDQSGSNVISGTELATRTVTLKAGSLGGNYVDVNSNTGFVSNLTMNFAESDPLAVNPSNRITQAADGIDFAANVFQPASVTASATNLTPLVSQITLTNAAPTSNVVSGEQIGLRAAALVTAVSAPTAQAGFTLGTNIVAGTTTLVAGTPASGTNPAVLFAGTAGTTATFNPTGKLNGVYSGSIAYTLQHADQTIVGTAPNDIGAKVANFSATVSGNSGSGTANLLPGGSYAGYFINRGSGANTTVSFLGGTASASGANPTVNFSTSTSANAAGDVGTITGTGNDLFVVQYSYSSNIAGNAISLGRFTGTNYAAAAYGNSNGNVATGTGLGTEIAGPYNGTPTLGNYGIDTANHVVWAVVDRPGAFLPYTRAAGDANFDGKVDFSDIQAILSANKYNQPVSASFAEGDFNGDGKVTFADIQALLSANVYNKGPYDPTAVPGPAVATPSSRSAPPPKLSNGGGSGGSSPSGIVALSTTTGAIGDGKPSIVYNTSTGDIQVVTDGVHINSIDIKSAGSLFTHPPTASNHPAPNDPNNVDSSFSTHTSSEVAYGVIGTSVWLTDYDYGNLMDPNNTQSQLLNDLTITYTVDGQTGTQFGDLVVTGTPEPTALSLVAVGGGALLARRRKRKA